VKQWHILTYDVCEAKRLRQVHYFLKKRAIPLQKSVFLLHCSAADLAVTLHGVRERCHLREDDIRLFPLTSPRSIWAAGQQSQAVQGLYVAQPQALAKTLFG
jgi:CRISPR-associated protein Cas2